MSHRGRGGGQVENSRHQVPMGAPADLPQPKPRNFLKHMARLLHWPKSMSNWKQALGLPRAELDQLTQKIAVPGSPAVGRDYDERK